MNRIRIPLSGRIASAIPDAVSASVYLWCWLSPNAWRTTLVAELFYAMVFEFLIIQASFAFACLPGAQMSGATKVQFLVCVGIMFALLGGGFAYLNGSLWLALGFGWLIASWAMRFFWHGGGTDLEQARELVYWCWSMLFFAGFGLLTRILPTPHLGMTANVSNNFGVKLSDPHQVIAMGFLFFCALAITKLLIGSVSSEWNTKDGRTGSRSKGT